jgi:hypothetical protein
LQFKSINFRLKTYNLNEFSNISKILIMDKRIQIEKVKKILEIGTPEDFESTLSENKDLVV